MVEGDRPQVVHVPTWERMQPAVDSMEDAIAMLCADMVSVSNPDKASEIRKHFKYASAMMAVVEKLPTVYFCA